MFSSALTTQYPDLSLLRSVLAGLSLPRQDEEGVGGGAGGAAVSRPTSPWNLTQLAPFINRIAANAATDGEWGAML